METKFLIRSLKYSSRYLIRNSSASIAFINTKHRLHTSRSSCKILSFAFEQLGNQILVFSKFWVNINSWVKKLRLLFEKNFENFWKFWKNTCFKHCLRSILVEPGSVSRLFGESTWSHGTFITKMKNFTVRRKNCSCAADFSLLNFSKGKSLGRSKPATNS
jgi:hypothetical protein